LSLTGQLDFKREYLTQPISKLSKLGAVGKIIQRPFI
ncbi:hypothetical protein MTR67_019801, partial [Solanum verrucosum]